MPRDDFEIVLRNLIVHGPLYRSVVVLTKYQKSLEALVDLWNKHGVGTCWSYDQEYSPRKYEFHPSHEYCFIVMKGFVLEPEAIDLEASEKLYWDPAWRSEKEVRMLSDKQILVQSVEIINPFRDRRSEVFTMNREFSTGKSWFKDKIRTSAETPNPYFGIFRGELEIHSPGSEPRPAKFTVIRSWLRRMMGIRR